MRKNTLKFLILSVFAILSLNSYAQNSVGIGTSTPDTNAVLDLVSTSQGLLVPRMDTTTINALVFTAAENGMLLYADDVNAFVYWDGDSLDWFLLNENVQQGNGADNDWKLSITGDTVYNDNAYVVVGGIASDVLSEIRMLVQNNGVRTALAGASDGGDGSKAIGVEGYAINASNVNIGVLGIGESKVSTDTVVGVLGEARDVNGFGIGVRGEARGKNTAANVIGVMGEANTISGGSSDTLIGVFGRADGGVVNWAANFPKGNVYVGDTLVVKSGSGTAGNVLTDDGSGKALWMPVAGGGDTLGNHIMTQNLRTSNKWISNDGDSEGLFISPLGNIGIGTAFPSHTLTVWDDTPILGLRRKTNANTAGTTLGSIHFYDVSNNVGHAIIEVKRDAAGGSGDFPTSMSFQTTLDGTSTPVSRMLINNKGFVGFGTTNPDTTLHVVGNIKMVDGNEALGKVLTSDANGVGSWQAPAGGTDTSSIIADADRDTYVGTEGAPDEDIIRFYTGNAANTPTEFFRMDSGRFEVLNTGNSVFIGEGAGAKDDLSSNNNVFIGRRAGNFNTTGYGNIATGYEALFTNTTGYHNSANGFRALLSNTGGYRNTANGMDALYFNTTGADNTAEGTRALSQNTTGVNNVALGSNAGDINKTGTSNTFLGYNSDASADNLTNATAIGANAQVGASNSMILGSINGVNGATANTNVGIGTITPQDLLHIHENSTGFAKLRFTNTTANKYFSITSSPQTSDVFSGWNVYYHNGTAGSNILSVYGDKKVAINATAASTHNFDVFGTSMFRDTITYIDGSEALGNVLTSDASGNATWQAPSGGDFKKDGSIAMTGDFNAGGQNIYNTAFVGLNAQSTLQFGEFTTAQQTTFAAGLAIADKGKTWYNSTLNEITYWNGSTVKSLGGADWSLTGNAGTTPGTDFIGTTDSKDFIIKTKNQQRMKFDTIGGVTLGGTATLTGIGGISIGNGNTVGGNKAIAIGNNVDANHLGSMVLGDWSGSAPPVTASSTNDQFTARFNGGYRFFTTTNLDASKGVYFKDGNVGIGFNNPVWPLQVETNNELRAGYFKNVYTTGSYTQGVYGVASGAGAGDHFGGYFETKNGSGKSIGVGGYGVDGDTVIGVYGNALNGTLDNFAGYFDNGDVFVKQNLLLPLGAGAGKVLTSDASGKATWQAPVGDVDWTISGSTMYNSTKNVVVGNTISAAGVFTVDKDFGTVSNINPIATFKSRNTSGSSAASIHIKNSSGNYFNYGVTQGGRFAISGGSNIGLAGDDFVINNIGNIGIGTGSVNPSSRLDILGPAGTPENIVKIGESGTAMKMKLTSGTTAYAIGGGNGSIVRHDIMINHSTGNVGIGAGASPSEKLQVDGNIGLGSGSAGNGLNKAIVVYLTNNSGAARVLGDIVIASSANGFDVTIVAAHYSAIGVLTEGCAIGAVCKIAVAGVTTVRGGGSTGQHCITSTTLGEAGKTTSPANGTSIGVYLTNSTGIYNQVLLR